MFVLSASVSAAPIESRDTTSRWTYYDVGTGACGWHNKDSDYVVALSSKMWEGGAHCGKKIMMKYGGKTAVAQVVDVCEGCQSGGLDLSPALFQHFASTKEGVIKGSWHFGDSKRDAEDVDGDVAEGDLDSSEAEAVEATEAA